MQSDILDDAVALVEDAEHGHALGHWSDARMIGADGHRRVANDRPRIVALVVAAPPASGEGER